MRLERRPAASTQHCQTPWRQGGPDPPGILRRVVRQNTPAQAAIDDHVAAERRLTRQYVKLCDLADFDDPELRARIHEIVPDLEPPADLHRKYWEYAMLTLLLEDVGKLDDESDVLSVGAGHEEVLYWLCNRVRRVVATDIYGEGSFADREADASMLTNPSAYAPYPYREDRLEVWKMDARELQFDDECFDVVFSLSSIEHFGSPRDIGRAASEIGRVLKPGGYAFIATECFTRRHPLNSKLVQTAIRVATLGRHCEKATPLRRAIDVFTPRELISRILRPSGLRLVQPIDLTLSAATHENVIRCLGGRFEFPNEPFPHIVVEPEGSAFLLRGRAAPFTSIALAMSKPASPSTREPSTQPSEAAGDHDAATSRS
jgi:SAM-dependent methyltransferase